MNRYVLTLCAVLIAALAGLPAMAADEAAEARVGDPYALNVCAISGEALGEMGDPVIKVYDGREVRFCCASCIKTLEKDPEKAFAEIDKKMIEQQTAHYPLAVCPISGKELTDSAVAFVAGNRLVKTCCEKCAAKVKADPAAAIAKLDAAAIEKQKADYKAKVCPISGKELPAEPVDTVVANELVRLCCPGCKEGVAKNPAEVLKKIHDSK
ncbi:MAG: hypothetical protein HYV27_06265 [Candidatus Hydrogenedentes bacterium]|nr:hypothetical protein [Candidatus Hydrogenedentota bacterium]